MKITILFIFIQFFVFSQETIILNDTTVPRTKGFDKDPLSLVTFLLLDRKTEKEKFDRLFSWVAINIKYDYKGSISTRIPTKPKIKRLLKRKKGTDRDYAFIMDTLCSLAGIQNVSINGYVKDELFNIGDSFYYDNSMWNAVKLDGKWFVYDVSKCTGQYCFKYTKTSSKIDQWIKNINKKKKKKTINHHFTKIGECEKTIYTIKTKRVYYQLSWFNQFLSNFLSLIKPQKKQIYSKVTNDSFYLTNPERFAITHIPTIPYWSLLNGQVKMNDFIADSTEYDEKHFKYKGLKKEGRFCLECDLYFSSDELGKALTTLKQSSNFNDKNKYITSKSQLIIADRYYQKSNIENDSMTKVSLLDSSLFYISLAKKSTAQCSINLKKDIQHHKIKNKAKFNLVSIENKKHTKLIESIVKTSVQKKRKMESFQYQTKILKKRFLSYQYKLNQITYKEKSSSLKAKPEEKVKVIENTYYSYLNEIDSISTILSNVTTRLDINMKILADNIWKDDSKMYSIIYTYNECSYYRWDLYDSYDEGIIDSKIKINELESSYLSDFNNNIFKISDTCSNLSKSMFSLIKKRYAISLKASKLLILLIQEKRIEQSQLKILINKSCTDLEDNICWMKTNKQVIFEVSNGLLKLSKSQKRILKAIFRENRAEKDRYEYINRVIDKREIKYTNMSKNNEKVISKIKQASSESKRLFLELLKMERKKNRI